MKKQTANKSGKLEKLLEKYKSTPDLMCDGITDIDTRTRYGDQLIHIACVSGNASDVEELISLGADVNSPGEGGYTPLHYAAEQGHLDVVKVLLDHGANRDAKDKSGESALDIATALGNEAVVNCISLNAK